MGTVRYKNAARNRRSNENEELKELSDLLPLDTCKKSLDKGSVLRLTAAYVQLKEFSEGFKGEGSSEKQTECCSLEELGSNLLQCLDGFLLVVGLNGKTIYVSETVTNHLGLSQIEMTGDLIYGYIHPEGKSELESFLVSSADQSSQQRVEEVTKLPVKFTLRMRCTLSRRQCGFVVDGYKIIHCSGYLKFGVDAPAQNEGDPVIVGRNRTRKHLGSGLILICQSFPTSIGSGIRMFSHMFMFRLGLDFTILYAESEVFQLIGYEPSHLHGKNLYSFLHPLHLFEIQRHHTIFLKKGQAITPYYAFLTNGGGWLWMQSYLVRKKCGKPPRDCVTACNYVLSERRHANLVLAEEQSCMLNSCCKAPKYNKRTQSSSNHVISKKSNNIFKCCFTSAAGSRGDNVFAYGKGEMPLKKADTHNRIQQHQSCVPINPAQSNNRDPVQSSATVQHLYIHSTIPLSKSGTEGQLLEQFRDRTNCDSVYEWNNDQGLQLPGVNAFQKIPQISETCDPLQNFRQMRDNEFFNDSNRKASNLHKGLIPSSLKDQSSFERQKSYLNLASLNTSTSHQLDNNSTLASKPNGSILNPVLNEEYNFLDKSEDTAEVALATRTEISRKPESILKTLLTKSPDIPYPSTSKISHGSFANNRTLPYLKRQLTFPTYSKLNLDIPLAGGKSRDLYQPKLLSPVSETALDFNYLQIHPAGHIEKESSKQGDSSTYFREFPSTSACTRHNIREIPSDFSRANAKRVRSYCDFSKRNCSTVDSVLSIQKPEINNNNLHFSEADNYGSLLSNTVVGCSTKPAFGQLEQGIEQAWDGLEKENLIYRNDPIVSISNPFQTQDNKSLYSLVSRSPLNIDRTSQPQYTERKVLSLKQPSDRSDFNKHDQHLCSETKVLSSSMDMDTYCTKLEAEILTPIPESVRLVARKYFQNRSLETKVLSSRLESDKSNIYKYFQDKNLLTKVLSPSLESNRSDIHNHFQNHCSETKVLSSSVESDQTKIERNFQLQSSERKIPSSSFESMRSSHCSIYNYSPTSFLNDFQDNDFSDIIISNVDSETDNLYSSITFEDNSQLVSELSNALTSTSLPNTSSQNLNEENLHS